MADEWAKIANKYADDVVNGRIPTGEYVKAACRRHLKDLKKQTTKRFLYRFSEQKAAKVCDFISKLRHIKGKWAGTEIHLEPWQVFFLACVFGWVRKSDDKRRFREAYLEVARKNAKSTIAAGIGLYMLSDDGEPGAEVYSGATSERQAWEVFAPARLMAKRDPDFLEHFGITVGAQSLFSEEAASKFQPIVGNPGDGASPHCSITDEYHEHPNANQYETMTTGMGAREQPLALIITTAGSDVSGPCFQKRDEIIKILSGVIDDDSVFGMIYTLDEKDIWSDFSNWIKANPNIGVSVFEDYLQKQLLTAKQNVEKQNKIRCKHLNQWMNAATAWMDMGKWRRCTDTTLSLDDFTGKKCIIALDLATKIDLTAKAYLFQEDGKRYLFLKYYLPEETIELSHNDHYRRWAAQGWITETMGNVLDFGQVKEDLLADADRFDVTHIAYDPWQATQLATELLAEGAPMLKYPNTVATMSEAMKQLQAEIYGQQLVSNGDPVLDWMMSNVTAKIDFKDNIFPRKEIDKNKIDGVVAAIMAMGVSIQHQDTYISGYESGIEFI
jgi:phage terminase large subunit-like protein